MHELDDILKLADLNLVMFEGSKLQVVHHLDVLDLKWNFEDILADKFLQASKELQN